MPWNHILAPVKGMMTHVPTTAMDPRSTPYCKGVYLKNGEVRSDFGMVNFPVPGLLKTNLLNGTVMKLEQLFLLNGVSYLLAFTTTNLYNYNTSTGTWDCITQGEVIEDCEDAWVASANVTCAVDATTKLKGTYSSKITIGAAFTTGLAAYEDFTPADLTGYTGLHFWIRSNVAVAAGDLQILIDNTSGCVSPLETIDIPALEADTWASISIDFATPAGLAAALSVGLNVVTDNGAQIVHIDDVRAVKAFTGDEDNRWSVGFLNDTLTATNGVDNPIIVSSGPTVADAVLTLPTGALTTCEIVLPFKDHMLYFNNTENGGDAPQRCSWSNIGDTQDLVSGTAGFQDLLDDDSWIIGAAILNENEVAVYKERSVVQCTWVGGATPFRFRTIIQESGIISKDCVASLSIGNVVVGPSYTYLYKGVSGIEVLDDAMKQRMYSIMDGEYLSRMFLFHIKEDDEIQIWVATAASTPDEGYCFNLVDKNWYLKDRNISAFGFYKTQSALTIGDLVGTIGEQNWTFGSSFTREFFPITLVGDANGKVYQLDKGTLNNAGAAIENEFQTPDFILPNEDEYLSNNMRVCELAFEASGQSIITTYSTDGGLTWAPTEGAGNNVVTLDSLFKEHEQFFETDAKKIRFKFYNGSASSGFQLRYYGFKWYVRTRRR